MIVIKTIKYSPLSMPDYSVRCVSRRVTNTASRPNVAATGSKAWFLVEISDAKKIYDHKIPQKDLYSSEDVSKYLKKSKKYKFIVDEWNNTNVHNQIHDIDRLYKLASKFKKIGAWMQKIDDKYTALNSAPEWLRDIDGTSTVWDKRVQEYMQASNEVLRKRKLELQKLSAERLRRIEEINSKCKSEMEVLIRQCPEVAIDGLTVDSIPIDEQNHSETIVDEIERKQYLNNRVNKFKAQIYRNYLDGVITVDSLIEMLDEKL